MKIKNKNQVQFLFSLLVLLLILFVVFWFIYAVSDVGNQYNDQELLNLESSLRRAAAACYAIEGAYPSSLEYLQQHYGIQIDASRYNVFYNVFAENLMPDITIVEKE